MNEDFFFEKIEQYLDGKISIEETKLFEAEVAQNPQLKKEIFVQRSIRNILSNEKAIKLEQELPAIIASAKERMKKQKTPDNKNFIGKIIQLFPSRKTIYIAASIFFFTLAGFLVKDRFLNKSSVEIASLIQNNAVYDIAFAENLAEKAKGEASNTEIINSKWNAATKTFNNGQLNSFLQQLEETRALDPKLDKISPSSYYYYQGIAYLKLKNYGAAYESFSYVNLDNYTFGEAARWNKILSGLSIENKKSEAMQELHALAKNDNKYNEKAKKLLEVFNQ